MIVGTAGHIDHGKTALVRALTGVETDRLKEEKARGISIDLGFAYWPLADGSVIGFVDVPGHEALVHNMLAGATGIDVVMLVVAADDGVMPQTREHLAIMDLLGLEDGVVALNKSDRVSFGRLREAEGEVRAALAGTGLAEAQIIPVSALTGAGIDTLKQHLMSRRAAPRAALADRAFRLAVDRAFTLKGQGTTVTGVVLSGAVAIGDQVIVTPPGLAARVRSLHAQNRTAARAVAGQRCALVLVGDDIGPDRVHRGNMIVEPRLHAPTSRLDVSLRILASDPRPIGAWFPAKVHHGASEVPGRIVPLAPERIAPGERGLAQLVLERPLAACNLDRIILRDTSSSRTVGGGVVLDVRAPERRRRTPERLATLAVMQEGMPERALAALLERGASFVNLDAFARDRALKPDSAPALAAACGADSLATSEGTVALAPGTFRDLEASIGHALDRTHREHPDQPGVPRERLRLAAPGRPPVALFNAVLALLQASGALVLDRSWVRRPSHQVRFSNDEELLWRRIFPRLLAEPYRPPRVRDIAKALDIDEKIIRRLAKMAMRRGDVEEIATDHFFARSVVERVAAIAVACAEAAPKGEFTAADLRDRLDNGRKVAIQLLEYFDRHAFTIRRGDLRRINPHRAALFLPAAAAADAPPARAEPGSKMAKREPLQHERPNAARRLP